MLSYIIWSFDPTGNVLYDFTDWDDLDNVIMFWVLKGLVTPVAVQITMFLIYRLKLFIFKKTYGDIKYDYEEISGY